jgi:hypothetical protein
MKRGHVCTAIAVFDPAVQSRLLHASISCLSCRSGELTADELSIALERLGWPDERCSLDKVAELMDK